MAAHPGAQSALKCACAHRSILKCWHCNALTLQVANVFGGGIDKKPLDEREQFVIDNMHLVSDSATHPLEGTRWWQSAEDPWQCLAACMELHKASQLEDPSRFESCLPVHQDGSCNGLQHYAALARDEDGGRAVNLLPGDAPADVYKCAQPPPV